MKSYRFHDIFERLYSKSVRGCQFDGGNVPHYEPLLRRYRQSYDVLLALLVVKGPEEMKKWDPGRLDVVEQTNQKNSKGCLPCWFETAILELFDQFTSDDCK